jgi:acyl-CoA thioester hydrolase
MSKKPKELESSLFVAFSDCDPFGHLNNARYLDYFMNTRDQQLKEYYQLSLIEQAAEGWGWFSTQNLISYLKPAAYGEKVWIKSRLIGVDEVGLHLEMMMYNEDKSQLKAVLWAKFLYVDLRVRKKTVHSEDLMAFFNEVCFREENLELQDFDKRIQQLSKR